MAVTEGSLGMWRYQRHYKRGSGSRIVWKNPPPPGTQLLDCSGVAITVGDIGITGKVTYSGANGGFQMTAYPWELKLIGCDHE